MRIRLSLRQAVFVRPDETHIGNKFIGNGIWDKIVSISKTEKNALCLLEFVCVCV